MIKELIALGFEREEIIQQAMKALRVVRSEAEYIYAIETGEIEGDLVEVDKDGNEIAPSRGAA